MASFVQRWKVLWLMGSTKSSFRREGVSSTSGTCCQGSLLKRSKEKTTEAKNWRSDLSKSDFKEKKLGPCGWRIRSIPVGGEDHWAITLIGWDTPQVQPPDRRILSRANSIPCMWLYSQKKKRNQTHSTSTLQPRNKLNYNAWWILHNRTLSKNITEAHIG